MSITSDPIRAKAVKQYWSGLQKWAETQGLTKQECHIRMKMALQFEHLRDLPIGDLQDMAFEVGVIADGGPGL